MMHPLDAPPDLTAGTRGGRFWDAVIAEHEPEPAELELLIETARLLNELELLQEAVTEHGAVTLGSRGQLRTSPALLELRQGRAELRRLLDALQLEPSSAALAVVEGSGSMTSRRAAKAARTRWAGRGARHAS